MYEITDILELESDSYKHASFDTHSLNVVMFHLLICNLHQLFMSVMKNVIIEGNK